MARRVTLSRWAAALGAAVVALTGASIAAQNGAAPAQPTSPDAVIRSVRVAIAHGAVDDARKLGDKPGTPARAKAVAAALVAIYEGKDDVARGLLKPLVGESDRDDATLELGLLEMRHGRVDEGQPLLQRMMQVTGDMATEDYFRLARAADGAGEMHLANDAYIRISAEAAERADVQCGWGELFLETHQAPDAVKSFQDAIKDDSAWVPAYVGLARALLALDEPTPDEADLALKKGAELAPKDPGVWLLTAERMLEENEYAKAKDALDRAALVRPGSQDELALRAALAYSEDRKADVAPAAALAQAVNPKSAVPYRVLGRRASRMYHFDDAAAFARKALEADETSAGAHTELGLALMRLGDEKAARPELERAFQLDSFNQLTYNLLALLDTIEKFTVVEDGPFVFKFPANESAVLKPYALPLAEEAFKTFQARYGITPQGPILVEIFQKHDDFAVRTIGLEGITGALGVCFGRVVAMDSPTARPPGNFSWHATLWHEIAHVFTLQLSKYRVPRWLTEGISVYEENRMNPAWGREDAIQFAAALGAGKTLGVKGIAKGFDVSDSARLSLAYFEASLVVEHLVNLGGDAALRKLLLAYADGATDAVAFTTAFGKSLDQVEITYGAFVQEKYGALRNAMKAPAGPPVDPKDVAALKARADAAPGNFVSQLQYGHALIEGQQFADAQRVLGRAAGLAPQAVGSGSPHALLAEVALHDGDKARAEVELRALLAFDHTNVEAARQLSNLALDVKAPDDERLALQLVTDLDPFDAKAHTRFGRLVLQKGDAARAIVEFTAALGLGPDNLAEAHTDLGEAQLASGHRDEAKREALLALQEAPTYARAQDLLLAAIGK
jgi:tetratricopeptide (TPR) repeat protein